MGVGYAWWNETITVQGTAATGNLDVDFTATTIVAAGADYVTGGGSDDDKKNITFNFTNLYPGVKAQVSSGIINNSSIPVDLKNATISVTPANDATNWTDAANVRNSLMASFDGESWVSFENFLSTIKNNLQDVGTGESNKKVGSVYFKVDEDAGNNIQGKSISIKISLEWTQFNNN